MHIIGIYGASGFGREVMPLVDAQYRQEIAQGSHRLMFVDDEARGEANGRAVVGFDEFIATPAKERSITVAIASARVRRLLVERCEQARVDIIDVRASNTVILDEVEIGDGSILTPFVCLTSNITIGRQFQANIYSYVGHDCRIGDYVTFAPRVSCNGNIVIEDDVYVGTGAVIKQGTPERPMVLGAGCVIGMGAVVTKSVAPGVTVVGNPARPFNV